MNKTIFNEISDIKNPLIWKFFYAAIIFFYAFCYIKYAFDGWFFTDDFLFLELYRDSLFTSDIIHIQNNFGRFITRNLYWHSLYKIFGTHSSLYFLFNLIVLFLNCYFLYKFIFASFRIDFLAWSAVVIYFCGVPTIKTYFWISNSQHLIVHTLIFVFLLFPFQKELVKDYKFYFYFLIIFILGLYSNILFIFSLPGVLLTLALEKGRINKTDVLILGIVAMLSIIFLISSLSSKHVFNLESINIYRYDLNLNNVVSRLGFYMGELLPLQIKPPSVFLFILILCLLTAYVVFNKNKILILNILNAVLFYLPFAFLSVREEMSFVTLSYLFITVVFLYPFINKKAIAVTIVILLLSRSFPVLGESLLNPRGGELKKFIYEINNIEKKNNRTIYLKHIREKAAPFFWWYLGNGIAFNLFSDPKLSYKLYKESDKGIHNALLIYVDDTPMILGTKYLK